MEISQAILDDLTAKAKASERLRMNLDLRDSVTDDSQRMRNAIEPGSTLPTWQGTGTWQQSPNASRETQSGVL
jgi:cupin fold WbuC family metalloprotein